MPSESLSDKLQRLGVFSGSKGLAIPLPKHKPVEEVLGGSLIETPLGSVVSVEKQFSIDHQHGNIKMDGIPISPIILTWSKPLHTIPDAPRVVYLDTETSGLAGGTGTFAFMIGCGFMMPDGYRSIQLFLTNPESEPALLYALNRFLFGVDIIVTFNGKSFDLPIIHNRYILHRMEPSFQSYHHIDVLHLARKIWRERLPSRRLGDLEREILEYTRSEEDIPGWMVPEMYIDYLSTDDPSPLTGVFYHNCIDLLSLGALLKHLSIMIDSDSDYLHQQISDKMAIGHIYDEQKLEEAAIKRYQEILHSTDASDSICAIAYTKIAQIYRRQGKIKQSIPMLELAFRHGSIEAAVTLAIVYEHFLIDHAKALSWTEEAMRLSPLGGSNDDLPSLKHRRDRILRKMSGANKSIMKKGQNSNEK